MNCKILAVFLLFVGCSLAQERQTYRAFNYNYQVTDEDGNVHGETRTGDEQGNQSGTMLIQLISGLLRNARWEATPSGGFTITLESNEPGMGPESPAGANFNIQEAPLSAYQVPRRN